MTNKDGIEYPEPKKEGRELLLNAVRTIAYIQNDDHFRGMPEDWIVRKIGQLAKTALEQTSDSVKHNEPEMMRALEKIVESRQSGVDLDRGTVYEAVVFTHDTGASPERFESWQEQIEKAAFIAEEALEDLDRKLAHREYDSEMFGLIAEQSDAMRSVAGVGRQALEGALKAGAIEVDGRLWRNNRGMVVAEFENVTPSGPYVFTCEGTYLSSRDFENTKETIKNKRSVGHPQSDDLTPVEKIQPPDYRRYGDIYTLYGHRKNEYVDVSWSVAKHHFVVSVYRDHGKVYYAPLDNYVQDIEDIRRSDWADEIPTVKTIEQVKEVVAPYAVLLDHIAEKIDHSRQTQELSR